MSPSWLYAGSTSMTFLHWYVQAPHCFFSLFRSLEGLPQSLNSSWLQFLGKISYSLYLVHNPITGAVFRAGYMLTGRTLLTEAVWWAVSVATCVIAATFVFSVIERPSLRLSLALTHPAKRVASREKKQPVPGTPTAPER